MRLIEFSTDFGTEEQCRARFKEIRDSEGVVCKKCSSTEHYWLKKKQMYQCKQCRFRTGLRSGTVMESSKLPFQYWFVAVYLMTGTKKSMSAHQMMRELGHRRYEPIWAMMHKIRKAMGTRDSRYLLTGEVEIDEGFFETLVPQEQKDEPRKRGRGSQKQTMAMVFAESAEVENPKHGKGRPTRRCGYFKMLVCGDMTVETAKDTIMKSVTPTATKLTDGYSTYRKLAKEMDGFKCGTIPSEQAHIKLPWVHSAIGNLKRVLQGIFHHIRPEYLQNYIDEFCYKLNRRYFGNAIFQRGLITLTVI